MTKKKDKKRRRQKPKKGKDTYLPRGCHPLDEAAGFNKKAIGTHKDKLQEKVKHSDKEKDKKPNDHLSASCMR